MSDNTTDFFDGVAGGAGAPTALLKTPGDLVQGDVVEMFKRDYVPFGKTDPEPDEKEADGKRKQLVVIIQTESRNWANVVKVPKVDPSDANSAEKDPSEDDGKRAIYVPNRSNIQYAIGRAVSAAQAPFEVGGKLRVTISNLKDTGKGNPLKEHEALYRGKPDGFFEGSAPATPAQAAPAAPAATPEPTPAPEAPAAPAAPSQDPWASSPATSTEEPPF